MVDRTKHTGFWCSRNGHSYGSEQLSKSINFKPEKQPAWGGFRRESSPPEMLKNRLNEGATYAWLTLHGSREGEQALNKLSESTSEFFLCHFNISTFFKSSESKSQIDESFIAQMSIWNQTAKTLYYQWFFCSLGIGYFSGFNRSLPTVSQQEEKPTMLKFFHLISSRDRT